jgi:acyl-CoA dehydrogenase
MDFRFNERTAKVVGEVREFIDEEVLPSEELLRQEVASSDSPYSRPPALEELRAKARSAGLWNLFLPHTEWGGMGLSNLEYAPACEEMGGTAWSPEVFNCQGPDSGNIMTLADYGSPAQQEQWLLPLLAGEITSCFAMTEPAVASSDARNIKGRIERDGDELVINARKWFSTGSARDTCKICIFVGVTDPDAKPFPEMAIVLIPLDTPGVEVMRGMTIFGYHQMISHGEVDFSNVRVPVENLLNVDGFGAGQSRLGAGRIHHAMRGIGMAERALELMCKRVAGRETFGQRLADHGVVGDWIARSRIEIEQTRLLTLRAAWKMDEVGGWAARRDVAASKVAAAKLAVDVVDRSIQAHGAAGLSQDTVLAEMYGFARSLRFVDGPDEVHIRSLGRWEVRSQTEKDQAEAQSAPEPVLAKSAP